MRRLLLLVLPVVIAFSALEGCSDNKTVEGKKRQGVWRTKGSRVVNPNLDKLR